MKIEPELTLGFLISDVSRLMRERFNETAGSVGLTQAQARALLHLARNEGISQVALARLLEIQPITLLRQLDRLADAGLIERRPNPNDRRAQQLFLSIDGRRLLKEITRLGSLLAEDAFAGLDADGRRDLIATLELIKNNLGAVSAEAGERRGGGRRRLEP
ncbi:MAG: MarR family winged helix-turn-helix transcriptional regulator [Pseudomonadales bacterium]